MYYDDYEDDLRRPTPKQIRKMCLEIQKTWTPWQREFRAGRVVWEPRGWYFARGRGRYHDVEFCWTVPQYVVHSTRIGQSHDRRNRETAIWERVG